MDFKIGDHVKWECKICDCMHAGVIIDIHVDGINIDKEEIKMAKIRLGEDLEMISGTIIEAYTGDLTKE